jgi:hypothetical protein
VIFATFPCLQAARVSTDIIVTSNDSKLQNPADDNRLFWN